MSDVGKQTFRFDQMDDATKQALIFQLQGREQAETVSPTEMQQLMGQIYSFLYDDEVNDIIRHDKRLRALYPAVSPLVRTGRQDNSTERAMAKLKFKRALRFAFFIAPEETSFEDMVMFDTFNIFGYSAIDDQNQGWRGKLAAERVKVTKIEGVRPVKRGIWERLGIR